MQFSANLNCIIGERGTRKSTTFEAVRCISGNQSDSKVVDSEVWPTNYRFFWQDQAGQHHSLLRRKDFELENIDNPIDGLIAFDIDCFGQDEAARISNEAQSDLLALLRYLDKFVDLSKALATEEAARE